MRFDLTVNEFTRDLWADRPLEVFGEQFWRPYVHVARRRAAPCSACSRPARSRWRGEVFNVGHCDENYRKLDLVELITGQLGRGDVSYVHRDEDPRDYKVSFEKIRASARLRPGPRACPTGSTRSSAASRRERLRRPVRRPPLQPRRRLPAWRLGQQASGRIVLVVRERLLVVVVAPDVEPVAVERVGPDRLAGGEQRVDEVGDVEALAAGMCSSARGSSAYTPMLTL